MENYLWRVIMHDGNLNDPITVAMFLLEIDARKWAGEENKDDADANYSVLPPKKSLL